MEGRFHTPNVHIKTPEEGEGIRVADTWDWEKDRAAGLQCKAYGTPALMRRPTRVHVSWQSDNVLKVETDAGVQTRRFYFDPARKQAPAGPATLQGHSFAEWERPGGGRGQAPPGGNLKVSTSKMRAGWLRALANSASSCSRLPNSSFL